MWQDLVFMIGGFLFAIALFPTLMSKDKPPKLTSFLTGTILLVFAICYATMDLWLAFGATLLTATMWFAILAQKILYDKRQTL